MSGLNNSRGSTINLTDIRTSDVDVSRRSGLVDAVNEYGLNVDVEKDRSEHGDKTVIIEELIVTDDAGNKKLKTPPTAANTYAAKKTVAQGMMDIALITANANQLRYVIEFGSGGTFYLIVGLITISLLIQVAVGVSLIFKGRYDLSGEHKAAAANRLNNYVVVGVFIVTIINVFIASFSLTSDKTQQGGALVVVPAVQGGDVASP